MARFRPMGTGVNGILDDLDALAGDERAFSLGDVIEKIGPRGKGALLPMPGLFGITPVGAIPGVPAVPGVCTVLIALQVMVGRDHPWLPGLIRNRAVKDGKLAGAVARLRTPARWVDRHFGRRLSALTGTSARSAAAAVCIALGMVLPLLEVAPFATLMPLAAIALLGLALVLRDGALMAVAFAASSGALYAARGLAF